MILGTYRKQPADERDIPIDFSEYLKEFGDGDTIASATATSDDPALTIDTVTASDTAVTVWVRGGVDAGSYKVTVTATTVADRVKQVEFRVKVKDY